MSPTDVTVIMPAYNNGSMIAAALGSVAAQTRPPKRVVVVDDGSSDDTASVAEACRDRMGGIVLDVVHQPNAGAGAARNRALVLADTVFVAFLDADDQWLPEKLERSLVHLEADPALLFVGHNMLVDGRVLDCASHFREDDPFMALMLRGFVATSTVVARRLPVVEAGGFCEALRAGQDYDLWARLAACGRFVIFGEALTCYYVNPVGITSNVARRRVYSLAILRRHFPFLVTRAGGAAVAAKRALIIQYEAVDAWRRQGRPGRAAAEVLRTPWTLARVMADFVAGTGERYLESGGSLAGTSHMSPAVTILVATTGRPDRLREALQSVIRQTRSDWEAVVLAAAGDGTAAVVAELADPRVSVREGRSADEVVARVGAPWIAPLRDQDVWHPRKLELCLAAVGPHLGGLVHAANDVEDGRVRGRIRAGRRHGAMLLQSAALVSVEWLRRAGGFGDDPWRSLSRVGAPVAFLDHVLADHRRPDRARNRAAAEPTVFRKVRSEVDGVTAAAIERNRQWWERMPMTYAPWEAEQRRPDAAAKYDEMERILLYHSPFLRERFDFTRLKGKAVLDIGCGAGVLACLMARKGARVTAIDLTETGVALTAENARAQGVDVDVRQMNAERMQLEDCSFDFVWSWGVLHHSPRTETTLCEVARVLKLGGQGLVMVYHKRSPNYYLKGLWWLLVKGKLFRGHDLDSVQSFYVDGYFHRHFTIPEMASALETAGLRPTRLFACQQQQPILPLPLPAALDEWLKHRFGWYLVAEFDKPE